MDLCIFGTFGRNTVLIKSGSVLAPDPFFQPVAVSKIEEIKYSRDAPGNYVADHNSIDRVIGRNYKHEP